MEFIIPLQPQGLREKRGDRFSAPAVGVSEWDDKRVRSELKSVLGHVEQSGVDWLDSDDGEAFGVVHACVSNVGMLSGGARAALIQTILAIADSTIGAVRQLLEDQADSDPAASPSPRSALKAALYLLTWIVQVGEKEAAKAAANPAAAAAAAPSSATSKGNARGGGARRGKKTTASSSGGGRKRKAAGTVDEDFLDENGDEAGGSAKDWWGAAQREQAAAKCFESLQIPQLSRLWGLPMPEEDYVMMISRAAITLLEPSVGSEPALGQVVALLALLVTEFAQAEALSTALLDRMIKNAALVPLVARIFSEIASAEETPEPASAATVVSTTRGSKKTTTRSASTSSTKKGGSQAATQKGKKKKTTGGKAQESSAEDDEEDHEEDEDEEGLEEESSESTGQLKKILEEVASQQDAGATAAHSGSLPADGGSGTLGASTPSARPQRMQAMLREFLQGDMGELGRQTESAKNVEAFLVQLASTRPRELIECLDELVLLLDAESYVLRNAVLQCCARLLLDEDSAASDDRRMLMRAHVRQRLLDVSSYTRARALQLWTELAAHRMIPAAEYGELAEATASRLRDKAAAVRKYAAGLLTAMLRFNPFGPALPLTELETELARVAAAKDDDDATAHSLVQAVAFVRQLHRAIDGLDSLLHSANKSDVVEAVGFLTTCARFRVAAAEDGLHKRVLPLIWSTEPGVRDAVVDAYRSVHLQPIDDAHEAALSAFSGAPRDRAQLKRDEAALVPLRRALALLSLLQRVQGSLAAETSLEALLGALAANGVVGDAEAAALVDIAGRNVPGASASDAEAAMRTLAMLAEPLASGLVARLWGSVVRAGLPTDSGSTLLEKLPLTASACEVLTRAHRASGKPRFAEDHSSLAQLQAVVCANLSSWDRGEEEVEEDGERAGDYSSRRMLHWLHAVEKAFEMLFGLYDRPLAVAKAWVEARHAWLLKSGSRADMAALLQVLGHAALFTRVHVEAILTHRRKKPHASIPPPSSTVGGGGSTKKKGEGPRRSSSSGGKAGNGAAAGDKLEEELGVAAMQEENEAEWIQHVLENELVSGTTFLGAYGDYIREHCEQSLLLRDGGGGGGDPAPANSSSPYGSLVARSAASALCKYMLSSRTYCEKHLRLLFTLFRRSKYASVRASIAVTLGDLSARYPNLLEPWTSHFNGALRDENVSVRKNTVMVLTHMTLNDMMKAKTFVSQLAARLEDDDPRIRELARGFFAELAQKNNELVNVLPDILSTLSAGELSSESFRRITRYLFAFVQKERQVETFVEKLCHRFQAVKSAASGGLTALADLVFCIALLPHNEKSVRKLLELGKCYADMLIHDAIMQPFVALAQKIRRGARDSLKVQVDEWEAHLLAWAEGRELDTTGLSSVALAEEQESHLSQAAAAADGIDLL